mmetsp:Transcript_11863/g.25470  ORF Transcript_11863/g.25470 Transcript_11863/m.25470 type:complete len:155 (-) Transcript_11863:28-492(-)
MDTITNKKQPKPWAYLHFDHSGIHLPLRKQVVTFGRDPTQVDIKLDLKSVSSLHGSLAAPQPDSNTVRLECHGQNGIIIQVDANASDSDVIKQAKSQPVGGHDGAAQLRKGGHYSLTMGDCFALLENEGNARKLLRLIPDASERRWRELDLLQR